MKKVLVISLCLLLVASFAIAKKADKKDAENIQKTSAMTDNDSWRELGNYSRVLRAPAALDTTYLIGPGGQQGPGTFEAGGASCTDEGWIKNDNTAQLGN